LHAAGCRGIGGAARPVGTVGEERLKTIAVLCGGAARGREACVVRNHRHPAQVAALRRDHLGIGGLRERGDGAAMVGKIPHFRRRRAGIGGDRDGAEFDAGKPGQQGLDAIVEMDQYEFARFDATRGKSRGQRSDALVEFTVTPAPRRRIERRPDQKRMIAPGSGPHLEQPRHVDPSEWSDDAGRWR